MEPRQLPWRETRRLHCFCGARICVCYPEEQIRFRCYAYLRYVESRWPTSSVFSTLNPYRIAYLYTGPRPCPIRTIRTIPSTLLRMHERCKTHSGIPLVDRMRLTDLIPSIGSLVSSVQLRATNAIVRTEFTPVRHPTGRLSGEGTWSPFIIILSRI